MKNKKKMTILIPNAGGPNNSGDVAILVSLIKLLKKYNKSSKVVVHSIDPHKHVEKFDKRAKSLYYWALFEQMNPVVRLYRFVQLNLYYLVLRGNLRALEQFFPRELVKIVDDYKNASLIVLVGGGYYRSQKKITQSLQVLMQYIFFLFAIMGKKNIVVAPVSFGPYAYSWQGKFTTYFLKKINLVSVREEISFRLLKKHGLKNLVLSHDLAFLFQKPKISHKSQRKIVIGLTLRDWHESTAQARLEKVVADALTSFAKKHKISIQPIVQVKDSKLYGDNDSIVLSRVVKKLKKNSIEVFDMLYNTSLVTTRKNFSQIDIMLGMRMHSVILAALQGIPYVALSYEHKTDGISRQLLGAEYVHSSSDVTFTKLTSTLTKLLNGRKKLQEKMLEKIKKIQEEEDQKWKMIFSNMQI